VPVDVKPRVLSTAINEDDGTASLDRALSVSEYFDVGASRARRISKEVGQAVAKWRTAATEVGIAKAETNRMASAFEHADLQDALKRN